MVKGPMTPVLAFTLAACVAGCAGSSRPPTSRAQPSAALASAVPPDPQLERGLWHAPVPAPRDASKLVWAGTDAPAPCRALVNTGPVTRVDSEAEFEALFCRASDIDWRRLQLFWYRLAPMSGRALLTVDVVLNDSQINWLIAPEPCSDRNGPPAPMPAIVIARSDWPVIARPRPDVPADCPATHDGYGY